MASSQAAARKQKMRKPARSASSIQERAELAAGDFGCRRTPERTVRHQHEYLLLSNDCYVTRLNSTIKSPRFSVCLYNLSVTRRETKFCVIDAGNNEEIMSQLRSVAVCGVTMTKKRKACSPTQDDSNNICAELKAFIVSENAKCVKEIRDSNDRRLRAVEKSLSFALDSLSAVSNRQHSANVDIVQPRRETAGLKQRVLQLELSEDRLQQENAWSVSCFPGRRYRVCLATRTPLSGCQSYGST